MIRKSTIPQNHSIRSTAKDINGRVMLLMATKKVDPAGGVKGRKDDVKSHLHSTYKLPRIVLPNFDGQLQGWNGFWLEYKEAVHNNDSLTSTQKLAYLRQCMSTSKLKDLLMPSTKNPSRYEDLVVMLQERYDKPRKLHTFHSKALVDLPICRNTAEELLDQADRLQRLVDGLTDLGQWDIHSIATSIGVPTLPPVLQTEWETLTQDEVQVPPVKKLINFMRKKSSNICQLGKKGDPAPLV